MTTFPLNSGLVRMPALSDGARAATRVLGKILLTVSVIVMLWFAMIVVLGLQPYQVPMPWDAGRSMMENSAVIFEALRFTAMVTGIGLAVSLVVATLLAVAFVVSMTMERAMLPLAIAFRATPIVAIAPLLVLLLDRGVGVGVVTVTIVTFFPILINLVRGMRSVGPGIGELMHVLGASERQVFRYARFPAAISYLFVGIRIAAAEGFAAAMLAEWLTGSQGIGHLLVYSAGRRDVAMLWATMAVAAAASILIFHATGALERHMKRRFPTL